MGERTPDPDVPGNARTSARVATLDDLPAIARMFRTQTELHLEMTDDFQVRSDADWLKHVTNGFKRKNSRTFVAERNGLLVGYIYVYVSNNARRRGKARQLLSLFSGRARALHRPRSFGVIEDLYVVPDSRKSPRGAGFRLCMKSLEWFRSQGVDEMRTIVVARNSAVLSMLHRVGFEDTRIQLSRRL